ncbi:MAG: zinc carboxypeptidase, partial [Erysipelotrichaceae bacterium]|nr:zinc carboxypeptidase [Erysipelotrichaceae bacterium]
MKTTFVYDHYFLYEEIMEQCNYYVNTYPQLVSMETLCMTQENRPVVALTLTNQNTGYQKPGFYIDANHHAGEVTGSMVAMHTMDTLLTNYGSDENITKILDTTMVYIIPRVSPDGS